MALIVSYLQSRHLNIAFSLCYKGNNLKIKHARDMVLVYDMSSECALQMYEASLNISNGDQFIERTLFCDGETDRWLDGRTDGRKSKNNMSPDPSSGET